MSDYQLQLSEKQNRFTELLSPFISNSVLNQTHLVESEPTHYRMRAEFRVWHDGDDLYHVMFDQESKQKYKVVQLPAACELINRAMIDVISAVKVSPILRNKLFQVDYLSCLNEQLVVSLVYHKPLDEEWHHAINELRLSLSDSYQIHFIGRAKKQKIVCKQDFVVEKLNVDGREFIFKHVENSFTQPNAKVNQAMLSWAMTFGRECDGDLLELYCGAGNFSIPLATVFDNVVATEISKTSVNAAQFNLTENKIKNCHIVRLSAEEFVQAKNKVREFRRLQEVQVNLDDFNFTTVLVDPPRAGLDKDTLKMVAQYKNIIYISCNPETLADNLNSLTKTHEVIQSALFDQFPFTHHMEAGVILRKKTN
jgi:tRNA (uracil-5-)-methyltransferase